MGHFDGVVSFGLLSNICCEINIKNTFAFQHTQRKDQQTINLSIWVSCLNIVDFRDRLGGDESHQRRIYTRNLAILSGIIRGQYGMVQRARAGHILPQHRYRSASGSNRKVPVQRRCH